MKEEDYGSNITLVYLIHIASGSQGFLQVALEHMMARITFNIYVSVSVTTSSIVLKTAYGFLCSKSDCIMDCPAFLYMWRLE